MFRKLPSTDSRVLRFLDRITDQAIGAFALVSPFSIALSQAAQILGSASWLTSLASRKRDRPVQLPLVWPLCAFLAASLLSAITAESRLRALAELKSEWLPLVFFLLCATGLSRTRASRAVRILIGAGAIAAAYGLVQTITNGTSFRVQGTMGHYMTFAGLLSLIALMAVAQLLLDRPARDAWLISASVLILAALLMTQTRSAWLGFVVGSIALVWVWRRLYLLGLPLLLLLLTLFSPPAVKQRILSNFNLEDVTLRERLYMWKGGWNIFLDHPLTGAGPDNLAEIYPDYKDPRDTRPGFTHLHSNFVQLAAERGALGLIAWLWIWVAYFRSVAGMIRQGIPRDGPARALLWGSAAAVLCFLVAGVFECNYRDSEVSNLAYFIMALPFCGRRLLETPEEGVIGAAGQSVE